MIELEIVEQVAEIFATLQDVDHALARFLGLARAILGSPFGAIYLRDETNGTFARWAESPETPALHLDAQLVDGLLAEGGLRELSLDLPLLDELPAVQAARAQGLHHALALPLRHGPSLVGVLALGLYAAPALPEPVRRTLEAVARFPSAAIQHARTRLELERRANLGVILSQFGERALATVGSGALHRLILDTVVALTGSDQASVTEVVGDRMRVVAGVGKDEWLVGTEAPIAAMGEALSSEAPYVVRDVSRAAPDSLLIKLAKKNGAGSFMTIAMRHGDRVCGHLFAGAAESRRFPPEDVEAMRILAATAAAVLEQQRNVAALYDLAQAKDRFLRIAAHELRTPVTALYATMQLLQLDPTATSDGARRATILSRIERQSARLKRLVEQLLDSARLGMPELPLSRARVELVGLCRDVLEAVSPSGGPRVVLRGEGPVIGHWDAIRLEQLCANLLSNALRYTPPDGEVILDVRADADRAYLTVIDSGIGIPAAEVGQVFAPFFRATNVSGRHTHGLGLGLHIAYEIARRHGGNITVESKENAGTTFTVSLPLAP